MTITDVGNDNDFWVNNASGTTNLVIDVAGSMEFYPAFVVPTSTTQGNTPSGEEAGARPARVPRIVVHPAAPMAPRPR